MEIIIEYAKLYAPAVIYAVVALIIGLFVIKVINKTTAKIFNNKEIDKSLAKFLSSLINWTLKVLLFISIAGLVGIPTTSFIAILGAAGLAIGLALQGTLANFAGGVLLMLFKPYKIGDLIEVQGELGVVKEIQIFTTIILSPENKTIFLPNGAVMNGNIKNYTLEGNIRVDLKIGVAYDSDIKKTKELLLNILKTDERVLEEPAPMVALGELGDSAIVFEVRPFVKPEHYWDVYFATLEKAKETLDANGISIPYPHMEVIITK